MTLEQFITKHGHKLALQTKKPFILVKQELMSDLHKMILESNNNKKASFLCYFIHKWSKWEQFKVKYDDGTGEVKQRKLCLRCDKVKEEFVEFN